MHNMTGRGLAMLALGVAPNVLHAAERIVVTAVQDLDSARPSETISVSWAEVAKGLPGVEPDKIIITDSAGRHLAYQFTNFHPDDRAGRYDDVLFQHDFAAGEKRATFTIEKSPSPVPPFPAKVFARWVPERFDDFAYENDRIAHRIYGPALETDVAGRSRMVSSGIDVWAKLVSYPIIDRWYLRGHNNYHKDNGEGFDFYSVGTTRGDGGTGVWDGQHLRVSNNWCTCRVFANGPIRAVFELTYGAWDAGNGSTISEVKRFAVDAGSNLDEIESTYSLNGAESVSVAIGLGKMRENGRELAAQVALHPREGWMGRWTTYPREDQAQMGTGVVLGSGSFSGTAEDEQNQLALVKVANGQKIRYFVGAGWTRSGQFADAAAWNTYVADFAARVRSPIRLTLSSQ